MTQTLGLCWGSVQGAGLLELAEAASATGLAAIAVTPAQYAALAGAAMTTAEIRARLADLGVRVSVVDPLIAGLPGSLSPEEVPPAMRQLFEHGEEDAWRAAEALQATTINMTHFLGKPIPFAQMRSALAAQAERNHERGFASTIEFIPGTMIPDLPGAAKMIAGSTHLKIMVDTWHYARSGGTLADIDALPPGAIGGAQLNDWSPPDPGAPYVPMSGRLLPGDGSLPLADILQRIEANSPGIEVGIEVFNADLAAMVPAEAARLMVRRSAPLLVTS